jgi:hypothetical protein
MIEEITQKKSERETTSRGKCKCRQRDQHLKTCMQTTSAKI